LIPCLQGKRRSSGGGCCGVLSTGEQEGDRGGRGEAAAPAKVGYGGEDNLGGEGGGGEGRGREGGGGEMGWWTW